MTQEVFFVVPGKPVAQPRHRCTCKRGKPFQYLPADHAIHEYKSLVKQAFQAAISPGWEAIQGPVAVEVLFLVSRPKTKIWATKEMPRELCTGGAGVDTDNLFKGLVDALKGLAWVDDNQIAKLSAQKAYCSGDEMAHTEVVVSSLIQTEVDWQSRIASRSKPSEPMPIAIPKAKA